MTVDETATALAPVREGLLARARADADRTLARARADADQVLAEARREAARIRDHALAQGEDEGAQVVATERARGRRLVRAAELRGRALAFEQLRLEVVRELRALWQGDDHELLRDRLTARALRLLGPDATVAEAPGGGVLAEAVGARADLSLAGFAERALAELGPELDGLWAS